MPCLKVSEKYVKTCNRIRVGPDVVRKHVFMYLGPYYLCANKVFIGRPYSYPSDSITAWSLMHQSMDLCIASGVLAHRVLYPDDAILLAGGRRNKAGLAYAMHRRHPIHTHIRNSYRFRLER